jgi:uncharacterized protein YueI
MSTAALERFIKKYQTANSYNSKEIRLTLAESEEISTAIALVLANTNVLNERIISLQEQLLSEKNEIEITGGSFT